MQFWNSMQASTAKITVLFTLFLSGWTLAQAQNSPYSRYGLGDLVNSQNAVNKAMGGITQGYSDGQSLNFSNPASYSGLQLTTLDIGVEGGSKKISDPQGNTFHSGSGTLSYLQLGMPLKVGKWGLNFGMAPVSRMKYNIQRHDTLPDIGSGVDYLYQGDGGLYKAFVGTGYRIKGIRFGINAGYLFGSVENSTQALYPADSIKMYNSNTTQNTSYGSFFLEAGIQVHVKLSDNLHLELGASGNAQEKLSADRDLLQETFYFSGDPANQAPQNQDTASYKGGEKGKVVYPQQLRFGLVLHDNEHWMLGADYEMGKWSDYRYYGQKDSLLQDNWKLHVGGQYVPNTGNSAGKSYWSRVAYRAGFYIGEDYLNYGGQALGVYAFTFGAGLPVRNFTRNGEFTVINAAVEIGKRGDNSNPLFENFFNFSVGFNLSDFWFVKKKYR